MNDKWVVTAFLVTAACGGSADDKCATDMDRSPDGGLNDSSLSQADAGNPVMGEFPPGEPGATSSADFRSRSFWERRWTGTTSSGAAVQIEIISFNLTNQAANVTGFASSTPCLERISFGGSVFFDSEISPRKYPTVMFQSDARFDAPQAGSLLFEGPLYPTGRLDGLLTFAFSAENASKACKADRTPLQLSPID